MNAQELQLRAALHQALDDEQVTDADVVRLEGEVVALLDGESRRASSRGRLRWGLVAAAVVAVVATGVALWQVDREPSHPAGAPAREQPLIPPELVGLWRQVPNSPFLWEIADDGRIGWTSSAAGYHKGEAVMQKISHRVGDVFTLTSDTESKCLGDHSIEATSPTTLTVTVLSDTCDVPKGHTQTFERISPGPAHPGEALVPLVRKADDVVVNEMTLLEGSWLHAESGTLLAVHSEIVGEARTYIIDDDGDGSTTPDGRGLMSVAKDGSVLARPFARDGDGCTPRFAKLLTNRATLTTTSAAGGCFPAGSQQTWIRLN